MNYQENYKSWALADRFKYIISKYFDNQTEFTIKAEINQQFVNRYCTGKTAKMPEKYAIQIENNTGISSQFLLFGEGMELIEECKLIPLREIKQFPLTNSPKESKEPKYRRGDCKQMIGLISSNKLYGNS